LFVSPRRIPKLGALVKPATLFKFHKALVDRQYRLLFSSRDRRRKPGPKGPSAELIAAIVELKRRNPRFGCVRIARQISHAFGVDIDKDVVRRVLAKHYRPGDAGPSWLTFIAQAKDSLWSLDLFRCKSILLRSHWVLLVMDVFTRRIIGFGVERANIDGISVCRMFTYAASGQPRPKHVSTDHDPLFRFHRWLANLRVLEIEEIKSVPYAPVSHPFVERLIGTVRREYLDQVFFWNAADLTRELDPFAGVSGCVNARAITTRIACTARSLEQRAHNSPEHPPPLLLRSIATLGGNIAGVNFRPRLPPDFEFATHKSCFTVETQLRSAADRVFCGPRRRRTVSPTHHPIVAKHNQTNPPRPPHQT